MNRFFTALLLLCTFAFSALAQQPTGSIRGRVVDVASGQPIGFATIVVLGTTPQIGVTTDERGRFSLPPLAVGRYDIAATYLGYEPSVVREVMVASAKENVLEVALKESIHQVEEVVVVPRTNKEAPLNSMALAGGRMLSVEEASRFAGGLDDPARLAASFAGTAGEVTSNSISIRGNSPQSLQWRLEGIEIPNPSHYPEIGGVGGGILTAFSSQVLGNSDFFTGAFPAEYSNALSGVFDMALRNGNNQRYEHTAQLGTLGLEFASEGPFKKGGRGSYLINYRYSAMALAGDIVGGSLDEVSGMRYQDLSFKLNMPTRKAGTFTLWGIGTADHFGEPLPDNLSEYEYDPAAEATAKQSMGVAGLGHRIFLNPNSYLRSTLALTYAKNHTWTDVYDFDGIAPPLRVQDMLDYNTTLSLNSYINTKFSARHTNRTGFTLTGLFYNDNYNIVPDFPYPSSGPMANFADSEGRSMLVSAFTQSTFQLSERLMAELGVTGQYFALNEQWTIEPRVALRWQAAPKHTLAIAAGLHSRHERLDYYFVTTPATGDALPNKKLDLSRAAHLTMSYDWHVSRDLHLRIEPYYQHLYDLPVVAGTERSIVNLTNFYMTDALVASGIGRNMGIDMTLERYLRGGFYWMATGSIFDSKYKADERASWRNTRYNRGFIANLLVGKEWMLGARKQQVLGVNLHFNYMGGTWYTPLDKQASLAANRPIDNESRLLECQNPNPLVVHASLNYQIHRPRATHEFGVKMINLTGDKEHFGYEINRFTGDFDESTAAVSIPNIYYRISF